MTFAKLRALLAFALAAAACGKAASFGNDSESHFLVTCEKSCPDGSSCLCGVCTEPCSTDASCAALSPSAICVARSAEACADSSAPGATSSACDVPCATDVDCAELGSAHRCDGGLCRARELTETGSTNLAGSAGASSGDGSGSESSAPSAACCPGVSISWRNYTLSERCELSGVGLFNSGPDEACLPQLPPCDTDGHIDAGDVGEALAHPDVEQARAEGTAFFGWTGGLLDFRGFAMDIGGATIELGYDCNEPGQGAPPDDCLPIPAGVRQLRDLLVALDMQQRSAACGPSPQCYAPIDETPSCSSVLPRFAYDGAQGTCVNLPETSGCSSENLFTTFEACQNTCRNDPCALGVPAAGVPPERCPVAALDKCFPSAEQACLCACRVGGLPLEDCRTGRDIPGVATCVQ